MRLAFLLILVPFISFYQGRYYRHDIYQIFDSDLVVRGQIVQNRTYSILVRLDEIIKGNKYGLKPGDHVKLATGNNDDVITIFEPKYPKGIFYLKKYPNRWSLNGDFGYMTTLGDDSTKIVSAFENAHVPNDDFKRQVNEALNCFECRLDTFLCDPKIDSGLLVERSVNNEFIKLLIETQNRYIFLR